MSLRITGPRCNAWYGALGILATLPAPRALADSPTPLAAGAPGTASVAASPSADAKSVEAFRALCRSKSAAAQKAYSITVAGRSGWLFFASELRHVGAGKFWGAEAARVSQSSFSANADPLPAILDFQKQLDRVGVGLLIVPVPPKSVVYPDMLWDKAPLTANLPARLDTAHQQFYESLRANGVRVLDLTPELMSSRFDVQGTTYCRQDTHWSGRASVLAARRIRAEVANASWLVQKPKRDYAEQWKRVRIAGDLWQGLGRTTMAQETLPLRFIGTRATAKPASSTRTVPGLQPVAIDRNSPVLVVGDSHTLVFHEGGDMYARGAGLPDQLAREFGFPVDLIGVRGSGATPARTTLMRRARANPTYLRNKKLVIWCFSAREFTESSGWQKVPVVP